MSDIKKDSEWFQTANGKYETHERNGTLLVLRYGKDWPQKTKALIGDGYVLSLVQEILALRAAAEKAREALKEDTRILEWHELSCYSSKSALAALEEVLK